MSQNIISEVVFFAHSFLLGIVITFVYDGFLVLRRLIRHNLLLISLEDMIFWIACAIGVFYMLCEENNGILRWFAVLGATLGMIAYKESVSRFFVDVMSTIIRRIFHIIFKILRFLLYPVRFLGRKMGRISAKCSRKSRKAGKYMKNKLTRGFKLLKITLCKHDSKQERNG